MRVSIIYDTRIIFGSNLEWSTYNPPLIFNRKISPANFTRMIILEIK